MNTYKKIAPRVLNGNKTVVWSSGKLAFIILIIGLFLSCAQGEGDTESALDKTTDFGTGLAINEIPVNGRVVFPIKANLTSGFSGVIDRVNVEEGEYVQKDDVLLAFKKMRVAQLETILRQSQLTLINSKTDLESVMISTPARIAELQVASSVAAFEADKSADQYADLISQNNPSLALAQKSLAEAGINLDDAEEHLLDVMTPDVLLVSSAENKVAKAMVEVDKAEESLDNLDRDVGNLLATARLNVDRFEKELLDATLSGENAVRTAKNTYDTALEEYKDLFKFWLGVETSDDEIVIEPGELFIAWGLDVDKVFDRYNPIYTKGFNPSYDNPDTRWKEFTVWAWLHLHPGYRTIIGTCDDNRVLGRWRCIEREFEDSFDAYDNAKDALVVAQNSSEKTVEAARDKLRLAQAKLSDAQEDFNDLSSGNESGGVRESAKTRFLMAIANLTEAEEDLAELTTNIDPFAANAATAARDIAYANFKEAEEDLDRALNNSLDVEVARARKDLAAANAEEASIRLEEATAITAIEKDLARSAHEVALEEYREALQDFESVYVKAPFSGRVVKINVVPEDEVGIDTRLIDIVDPSIIEVHGVIDAASSSRIKIGSSAKLYFGGLEDIPLEGEVTSISEDARTERGIVSIPVILGIEVPAGFDVPIQMTSVTATINGEKS